MSLAILELKCLAVVFARMEENSKIVVVRLLHMEVTLVALQDKQLVVSITGVVAEFILQDMGLV